MNAPLRFCPSSCQPMQFPIGSDAHRSRFPFATWNYDPWTGIRRPQAEIDADPLGHRLVPVQEPEATTPIRAPVSPPPLPTPEPATGTQEPGSTDHDAQAPDHDAQAPDHDAQAPDHDAQAPRSPVSDAFTRAAAALQDLRIENETLTRSSVELVMRCRALRIENDRLRGTLQQTARNTDETRFGRATKAVTEAALNHEPGTSAEETQAHPRMRAAAGDPTTKP